jgi:predicted peroxiredoxin
MTEARQELHLVLVSNDPARAYPAIQLAMGANALGHRARVYCTTSGLDVVRKGAADEIRIPGFPPLGQLVRDALKQGVEICACAPSPEVLESFGITEETVEPGVTIEDVVTFLNEAMPAAKQGGVVTFI